MVVNAEKGSSNQARRNVPRIHDAFASGVPSGLSLTDLITPAFSPSAPPCPRQRCRSGVLVAGKVRSA